MPALMIEKLLFGQVTKFLGDIIFAFDLAQLLLPLLTGEILSNENTVPSKLIKRL